VYSYPVNLIVLAASLVLHASPGANAQGKPTEEKRPVSVVDAIRMTRLADESYFKGGPSTGRVAHFSPNGEQFVVLLRKGNLGENTNEYSLLLFQSRDVFRSPKPDLLLKMSSSSNRDAIKNVNWLEDNQTVAFIAENLGESPQVCLLNVKTKQLVKLTEHATPIVNYAISADGQKVIFSAEPPLEKTLDTKEARREGIRITTQTLYGLLSGDSYPYGPDHTEGEELFVKVRGESEARVPIRDLVEDRAFLSFLPNGRYAAIQVRVRDIPKSWEGYKDDEIHDSFIERRPEGMASYLNQYLLFDLERGDIKPLFDAPNQDATLEWRADSHGVLLRNTFLPLDVANPMEMEARTRNTYNVEVSLPDGEITKVSDQDLPQDKVGFQPVDVALEEGLNTPPEIYVTDPKTKQKALLLDLNPQFAALHFGRVEAVSWKVRDGHEIQGGLYFPPDFDPGKKYPLVIQTHGFSAERFWIDGPWSSAFAAQPLAGMGFVVLQVGGAKDQDDSKYISTEMEAPRAMAAYEGAIDYLEARGLIDRDRVGIVGFSRTFFTVGYALTHSKYRFSAATLVDGIDGGYFQYVAFSSSAIGWSEEVEGMNGGPPWGEDLTTWITDAPGFNLEKLNTPLRLIALGPASILSGWEWFSGLMRLQKPVDFIYLPDAPHLIVKPWERIVAQQGLVDWFRFWLKGEEDPDPAKAEQYTRWRELRKLQEQNQSKVPAN